MKIVKNILTNNPCYKAGRTIKVKGLMIHSVGCPQPSAEVFVRKWNSASANKCVHAFIDGTNGNVYQTLPWNHRAWHGGSGCNGTHIGVEMCEPATIKYTGGSSFKDLNPVATKETVMRTYNAAVELFAHLCKEYKLNPITDIVTHAEGHRLGIATNHGDPEHIWKKYGLTLEGFRIAVQAQMKDGSTNSTPTQENANSGDSGTPYKVRVTTDVLNIRKGAGTNHPVVGQIKDKGVYTIVDQNGTWGKLKSGAGWISLKYTKKI